MHVQKKPAQGQSNANEIRRRVNGIFASETLDFNKRGFDSDTKTRQLNQAKEDFRAIRNFFQYASEGEFDSAENTKGAACRASELTANILKCVQSVAKLSTLRDMIDKVSYEMMLDYKVEGEGRAKLYHFLTLTSEGLVRVHTGGISAEYVDGHFHETFLINPTDSVNDEEIANNLVGAMSDPKTTLENIEKKCAIAASPERSITDAEIANLYSDPQKVLSGLDNGFLVFRVVPRSR